MIDTIGHNSADERLKSIVDRLVRLHEERKALADDIADLLKEASGNGYDKAALKEVVKIVLEPAAKKAKRQETDSILGVYLAALGMEG